MSSVQIQLDDYAPWPSDPDAIEDIIEDILGMTRTAREIQLQGQAPTWACLCLSRTLAQTATSLHWNSPEHGLLEVFDHRPF